MGRIEQEVTRLHGRGFDAKKRKGKQKHLLYQVGLFVYKLS